MFTTEYNARYAYQAFAHLAASPLMKEEALCLFFTCTESTLNKWKSDSREFSEAIRMGLLAGETKLREVLVKVSMMPASRVNTKLISILASNSYGINEELVQKIQTTVEDHGLTTDEKLKKRGIPIPTVGIADIGLKLIKTEDKA